MRKDKFEKKGQRQRKSLVLVLACVLLVGGVVGGTVAWLTAESGTVTNVFTESNINITLTENNPALTNDGRNAKMIPGWSIDKDPVVAVIDGSEDCWLFVKITESTTPDLDAYIAYAIKDLHNEETNPRGWQIVEQDDSKVVIGRKVYKTDATKSFSILGAGEYTDTMGTDNTKDDYTISWSDNKVGVKPSVTEEMMTNISTTKPTLSFQAYAVQLKVNNENEFTIEEAWNRAE